MREDEISEKVVGALWREIIIRLKECQGKGGVCDSRTSGGLRRPNGLATCWPVETCLHGITGISSERDNIGSRTSTGRQGTISIDTPSYDVFFNNRFVRNSTAFIKSHLYMYSFNDWMLTNQSTYLRRKHFGEYDDMQVIGWGSNCMSRRRPRRAQRRWQTHLAGLLTYHSGQFDWSTILDAEPCDTGEPSFVQQC
jgi:hypothetical protein